jgi:hypothetical protein
MPNSQFLVTQESSYRIDIKTERNIHKRGMTFFARWDYLIIAAIAYNLGKARSRGLRHSRRKDAYVSRNLFNNAIAQFAPIREFGDIRRCRFP